MSGNKVHIGRFKANTGIGWFLVPNGWSGWGVDESEMNQIKYSNPAFNNFTFKEEHKQHVVILNDEKRKLFLMGFEDTSRPGGDNDFNDAVFYVTANPYTAVDNTDLLAVKEAVDSDRDGTFDHLDEYPNDPTAISADYYPAENRFITMAFEDMWPNNGDYDFNDVVVDLNVKLAKDAENKPAWAEIFVVIKALGGGYRNGFAVTIDQKQEAVASVEVINGAFSGKVFSLRSNGTEEGVENAVFPLFDNGYDLFGYGITTFINTQETVIYYAPQMIKMRVEFNKGQISGSVKASDFDPFIVINQDRTREVHLPRKSPTSKANLNLFNTADDHSDEAGYYMNINFLPWAMSINESFDYPKERSSILQAHTNFKTWVQSGGTLNRDWFRNIAGYRDDQHIYRITK